VVPVTSGKGGSVEERCCGSCDLGKRGQCGGEMLWFLHPVTKGCDFSVKEYCQYKC
jgi:hypothetical protein